MTPLRLSDFTTGTRYLVSASGKAYSLSLNSAQSLSDSGREGGSFRLEFLGPREPVLPQATYSFACDSMEHDIFIVPIAREAAGTRYEAVFY